MHTILNFSKNPPSIVHVSRFGNDHGCEDRRVGGILAGLLVAGLGGVAAQLSASDQNQFRACCKGKNGDRNCECSWIGGPGLRERLFSKDEKVRTTGQKTKNSCQAPLTPKPTAGKTCRHARAPPRPLG